MPHLTCSSIFLGFTHTHPTDGIAREIQSSIPLLIWSVNLKPASLHDSKEHPSILIALLPANGLAFLCPERMIGGDCTFTGRLCRDIIEAHSNVRVTILDVHRFLGLKRFPCHRYGNEMIRQYQIFEAWKG